MQLAATHVILFLCLVASQSIWTARASTITTAFASWADPDTARANETQLNNPSYVIVSRAGDVIIADAGNQRIRKLTPSGQLVTIAGRGSATREWDATTEENVPATIASFNYPEFLAFDSSGILHIGDTRNARVRKILPSGLITTAAVMGGFISGMAFDNNGLLIVAESAANRVSRVNMTSGVSSALAPGFAWDVPSGVAVDPSTNDVFVGEITNNRILKISAQGGAPTVFAGGAANPTTDGLATERRLQIPYGFFCHGGFLYFVEVSSSSNRVRRIDLATNQMVTIVNNGSLQGGSGDGGPATAAALNQPYNVHVHPNTGDLYVTEYTGQRVRKISSGIITRIAGTGTAGYSAVSSQGTLRRASDVDFDRSGKMVIGSGTDADGTGGMILTLNSAWNSLTHNVSVPADVIAVDSDDTILYMLSSRNQLWRWDRSTGAMTLVAGDAQQQSGNTGNRLNFPTDVHVTLLDNNTLIADAFNGRIVRLLSNGSFALVAGTTAVPPALSSGVLFVSSDFEGTLYISDRSANRIYKKTAAGAVTQFTASLPLSVAASPSGGYAFFVSSRKIYMINADGYVSRIAGSGASAINVDPVLAPLDCSLGAIGGIKAVDINTVYVTTYIDFLGGSAGRVLRLDGPFVPTLSTISVSLASVANFTSSVTGVPSIGYYVVVQQASAAPTAAQIIAGAPYAGVSLLTNGSILMQLGGTTTFTVALSNLPANAQLTFYLVAQDAGLNRSPVRSVQFSTPALPAPQALGASPKSSPVSLPSPTSLAPVHAPMMAPISSSPPRTALVSRHLTLLLLFVASHLLTWLPLH
jgi:sugar lactone lactonase YvrE